MTCARNDGLWRSAILVLLIVAISPCASAGRWNRHISSSACNGSIPKRAAFLPFEPKIKTTMIHDISLHPCAAALSTRGGEAAELAEKAYEWCTNLGAPAALVAGAVIATLYESMSSGNLDIEEDDKAWVKMAKKGTRLCLLSAFILQIVCIFTTTITGTHLLSKVPIEDGISKTPLEYLRHHFEFEYLTSRISFIQGLINWLGAIALEHFIPFADQESDSRRDSDILIAASLTTLILFMMSFYNGHMNFYDNYAEMLWRYVQVTWQRFFWLWPPRPLTILATPTLLGSLFYFFKVFVDDMGTSKPKEQSML